jgi:hypothetical protein
MARGWHGNSAGHAKAGQLGGRKSAENRRRRSQFGEQLAGSAEQLPKQSTDKERQEQTRST